MVIAVDYVLMDDSGVVKTNEGLVLDTPKQDFNKFNKTEL